MKIQQWFVCRVDVSDTNGVLISGSLATQKERGSDKGKCRDSDRVREREKHREAEAETEDAGHCPHPVDMYGTTAPITPCFKGLGIRVNFF